MLDARRLKVLQTAASRLNWRADGLYYDILRAYGGVESAKSLTRDGFERVMAHAKKCGFRPINGRAKYDNLGLRPGMATPMQLRMIEAMWRKAARDPSDRALRRFLKNRFGIEAMRFVRKEDVTGIRMAIVEIKRRKALGMGRQKGGKYENNRNADVYQL